MNFHKIVWINDILILKNYQIFNEKLTKIAGTVLMKSKRIFFVSYETIKHDYNEIYRH